MNEALHPSHAGTVRPTNPSWALGTVAAGAVAAQSHRWDVFPDLLRLTSALSAFYFLARSLRTRCVLIVALWLYLQGQDAVITHFIDVLSLKRQNQRWLFLQRVQGQLQRRRIYLRF